MRCKAIALALAVALLGAAPALGAKKPRPHLLKVQKVCGAYLVYKC